MNRTFANYHTQRAAFRALFVENCSHRILLLKGDSGSGKSSLLRACLTERPENANLVAIELRNTLMGVEEILSRSTLSIGKEHLPRYTKCVHELANRKSHVNVSDVTQMGEKNNLSVTLNIQNLRESEQRSLTEAWFEDVNEMRAPLIVAFDTYELAITEVKNWISGSFLSRSANCSTLRVAIAGQDVPEPGIEAWGQCYALHELFGVREAKEWMPVVEALGKVIPAENPLDWMAGTCNALKGKPKEIMEIIKTLPSACSIMSESNRQ